MARRSGYRRGEGLEGRNIFEFRVFVDEKTYEDAKQLADRYGVSYSTVGRALYQRYLSRLADAWRKSRKPAQAPARQKRGKDKA